jgi:hypothetical protein
MVAILGPEANSMTEPFHKKFLWLISELQPIPGMDIAAYGIAILLAGTTATLIVNNWKKLSTNIRGSGVLALTSVGLIAGLSFTANRLQVDAISASLVTFPLVIAQASLRRDRRFVTLAMAILAAITVGNIAVNFTLYANELSGRVRNSCFKTSKAISQTADTINNWADKTKQRPHVMYADPGKSSILVYFMRGDVSTTIYWESLESMKATAAIMATSNELAAMKELYRRGFNIMVIDSPKEATGLVLGAHGRTAADEAGDSNFSHYTIGKWYNKKTRPAWLKPFPNDPVVYEIDRAALEKAIEDKETSGDIWVDPVKTPLEKQGDPGMEAAHAEREYLKDNLLNEGGSQMSFPQ